MLTRVCNPTSIIAILLSIAVLYWAIAIEYKQRQTWEGRQVPPGSDMSSGRVVVVGGGLAGLCAALEAREAGASVVIVDKGSDSVGGSSNSAKATSGINAVNTTAQHAEGVSDSEQLLLQDTLRSSGGIGSPALAQVLSASSSGALAWLEKQGMELRALVRCGGHSVARTHRLEPDKDGRAAPIGWKLVSTLRARAEEQGIEMRTSTQVLGLEVDKADDDAPPRVIGVRVAVSELGSAGDSSSSSDARVEETIKADGVVLATGGWGASKELLREHAPRFAELSTTNGAGTTGDGIRLGMDVGASLSDMAHVQVHPTAFVHPEYVCASTRFLCPEALRGHGGVLVNRHGVRFCNELDLRSVVTKAIFEHGDAILPGDPCSPVGAYLLMADDVAEHFGRGAFQFYEGKGLITKIDVQRDNLNSALESLCGFMGVADDESKEALSGTLATLVEQSDPITAVWVAIVTPAVHYTMGGLTINEHGEVQASNGNGDTHSIRGLWAAGEVTGGMHGANRLAGNSLLECVVMGRICGRAAASSK